MNTQLPVPRESLREIHSLTTDLRRELARIAADTGALAVSEEVLIAEMAVADKLHSLQAMLTDELVRNLARLANTPYGFATDRPNGSYPAGELRQAFLMALLSGLHFTGNEFAIIGGRFYAQRAGLKRLCLQNLREFWWEAGPVTLPDNPRPGQRVMVTVPARATWKDEIGPREWKGAVQVAAYANTPVEALIGKAERKLFAKVLELSRVLAPPSADAEEAAAPESAPAASLNAPPPPRQQLRDKVLAAGFGFDQLDSFMRASTWEWGRNAWTKASPKNWDEVPEKLAAKLCAAAGLVQKLCEHAGLIIDDRAAPEPNTPDLIP